MPHLSGRLRFMPHMPTRAHVFVCTVAHTYGETHARFFFFWLERWNNLEPKFFYCFKIYAAQVLVCSNKIPVDHAVMSSGHEG